MVATQSRRPPKTLPGACQPQSTGAEFAEFVETMNAQAACIVFSQNRFFLALTLARGGDRVKLRLLINKFGEAGKLESILHRPLDISHVIRCRGDDLLANDVLKWAQEWGYRYVWTIRVVR